MTIREPSYNREVIHLINSVRQEWRTNSIVLGGTSGSGGGSGGAPGGYIGQLPQKYVAADSSELRVLTSGSNSSLVSNLNNIRYWETTQVTSTEPSPTFVGQLWVDGSSGSAFNIRNETNTGWIPVVGSSSGSTFVTPGSVLFVSSGSGATEDSKLFWDATNKRLLRGTNDLNTLGSSLTGLAGILNVNASNDGSAMVAMVVGSGNPSFAGFNIGGTLASPSATVSGKNIARLSGRGWGSTALAGGNRAELNFATTGDWTDTSQPAQMIFRTTGSGSTTLTTQMTLGSDGALSLTCATDSTSTSTGAIVSAGGMAIAKSLSVGNYVGVGISPDSNVGVYAARVGGGDNLIGMRGIAQCNVNTVSAIGVVGMVGTTAASFTVDGAYCLYASEAALGAGSTITTQYGLFIESMTHGATNYSLYAGAGISKFNDTTDSSSSTTGAVLAVGGVGIAKKLNVGTQLGVGIAALTDRAIRANLDIASGTGYGGVITCFATTTATETMGLYVGSGTSTAASYTLTQATGVHIGSPTKASGTTITYGVGLWIDSITTGATNWAIYANAGKSYFADTTDSSSTSTGAIVTDGGLGVAKNITSGGTIKTSVATSGYLSFLSYAALGYGITYNGLNISGATIGYACTLRRWSVTVNVSTTNSGSHYWTVALYNLNTSGLITSFTTASDTADAWTYHEVTGLSTALTTADKGVYVYVSKTGSPGALNVLGISAYVE